MISTLDDALAAQAATWLSDHDPQLAPVIRAVGPCPIRPHRQYYQELVDSIVSQQLSVKAAASIMRRFTDLFGDEFPAPGDILKKSAEEYRAAGLSYAKANYIRDLAQHVIDGRVKFDHLDALPIDDIIRELSAVKGIGVWTVHMFLIFCMGRPDVLATGDLGIRNGVRALYNFENAPTPQEVVDIAEKYSWHPYESIACWYVWQSLKNTPAL
jgi:DNA-3-methyladenine glycosylase II